MMAAHSSTNDGQEPDGFSAEQRSEILERGDYKCAICRKVADEAGELQVDHICPTVLGGQSVILNGQVLCNRHISHKRAYVKLEEAKRGLDPESTEPRAKRKPSQKEFVFQYFVVHPKKPIPTAEIVDWVIPRYFEHFGEPLRDPDRSIRLLHHPDGLLQKLANGSYMYDPDDVRDPEPTAFTPSQRDEIMRRGGYRCTVCGKSEEEAGELHADHIRPRSLGGKSTVENGQILCSVHNYRKKAYGQTETGKRMFLGLKRLAKSEDDTQLIEFIKDVLRAYEKHDVNSHIKWDCG